jgi:hypothetical protein
MRVRDGNSKVHLCSGTFAWISVRDLCQSLIMIVPQIARVSRLIELFNDACMGFEYLAWTGIKWIRIKRPFWPIDSFVVMLQNF